jgi:hypothetical protein
MHAWLPASRAAADVTVAARTAAFAGETGEVVSPATMSWVIASLPLEPRA